MCFTAAIHIKVKLELTDSSKNLPLLYPKHDQLTVSITIFYTTMYICSFWFMGLLNRASPHKKAKYLSSSPLIREFIGSAEPSPLKQAK